ncbi:helix-turn-helix transcriptional regulator [Paenibacillus sp. FSL H8-0259]|uniref:helix-turn-helix transcriptional regulator n=1 Tax=Paenibacillus sp. FSL H8-0259 TaxID=1920423 RepID=UPI00096FEF09|nr:helix-turn-helix transcriptional regulator [Paenibacillus sp. FSL H8-0259]OMF28328.1 transcriptional regulator [Paenibacillus sp. FSL H8-0259]
MAIGQFPGALKEVMQRKGVTLAKAGQAAHVDGSQIGKIVNGSRKASKQVMQAAATYYDDAQLLLAAAAEVTGGASVPWLNNADLHPSSTHIKTIEEIQEALQALLTLPITKSLEQLKAGDRDVIKNGIMEQLEAITALTHNAAALCRKYEFSYIALWSEHRAELKLKNYMK